MSRRNGRICLKRSPCSSLPMKTIGPSEEISRRMASPSVVFPDPDSPTTPSVSPLRSMTLMPSTALIWPTTLRKTPRLIGNQIGNLADDAEVMSDEQKRHAEALFDVLEERDDLRLDGDIERSGRFVGN